jgi:hypothetical protein
MARETGEPRWWVGDPADTRTCADVMAEDVPADSAMLSTAAWQSDRGRHPSHATVCHRTHAWARDDAGDGRRAVHGHTCEGAGAALRTSLRGFRGVHKRSRHLYVATAEAMVNTKRVTPELIRRMGLGNPLVHTSDT